MDPRERVLDLECKEHSSACPAGDYGWSLWSETEKYVVSFSIRLDSQTISSRIHGGFRESVSDDLLVSLSHSHFLALDVLPYSFNIGHPLRRSPKKSLDWSNSFFDSRARTKISFFRDDFWPSGILADKAPERDASIRNITQVLCKAKLLGIVSGKAGRPVQIWRRVLSIV